jgi:hypothetical protein
MYKYTLQLAEMCFKIIKCELVVYSRLAMFTVAVALYGRLRMSWDVCTIFYSFHDDNRQDLSSSSFPAVSMVYIAWGGGKVSMFQLLQDMQSPEDKDIAWEQQSQGFEKECCWKTAESGTNFTE